MTKEGSNRDALISSIYKTINDISDVGAYYFGDDVFNPSTITDWVSTGDPILDVAISNRRNGGLPVGRISEISGLEGSGKSLLAAHVLLETQKKDGIAVYIDTEQAQFENFLKAIGLNFDKLLYVPEYIIENIFELIESIVETTRKKDSNKLVTIVVDSVMGATHKVENEADYSQQGYNTNKSIIISQAMRKLTNMIARERILLLFTNQLRSKMDAMAFGEKYTTSGGKGIPFHASVRLQISRIAKIKNKDKVVGIKSKVKVTKSRIGPPFRESDVELYFNRGMDPTASWLKAAKDSKIVKTSGAWSKFGETSFQGIDGFKEILQDVQIKQQIYDAICQEMIMEYEGANFNIDDNILEEE